MPAKFAKLVLEMSKLINITLLQNKSPHILSKTHVQKPTRSQQYRSDFECKNSSLINPCKMTKCPEEKKNISKKWVKFSNLFVSSEEKRKIATFRTVFSQSLTRRKSSGKIKIFPNYCIYRKCQHIKITKCTKKHPGSYEVDSLTQWRTEEKQKLLAPVKIWRTLKLTNPLKCWQPAHSTY